MKNMLQKIKTWLLSVICIVRDAVVSAFHQVKQKPLRAIISLLISIGFGVYFDVSSGLLWLLFLLFLVYEWENRIIGVLALISLATCPILLSLNQNALAETMAQFAYFFLVMTVTLQIVEFKRHPERFEEDEEKHE